MRLRVKPENDILLRVLVIQLTGTIFDHKDLKRSLLLLIRAVRFRRTIAIACDCCFTCM